MNHRSNSAYAPQPETATPSRRTLLTAAAWSAPILALSVATPAVAASTDAQKIVTFTTGAVSTVPAMQLPAITGSVSNVTEPTEVTLTLSSPWTWTASASPLVMTDAAGAFSIPAGWIIAPATASENGSLTASVADGVPATLALATVALAMQTASKIASNDERNFAITTDGALYAWGWWDTAKTNLIGATPKPIALPGGERAAAVGTLTTSSYVLSETGAVYDLNRGYPKRLALPTNKTFVQIAISHSTSLALASDGTVYSWDTEKPAQITGLPKFVKVVTGGKNFAGLTSDGRVYLWGYLSAAEFGTRGASNPNGAPRSGYAVLPEPVVDLEGGIYGSNNGFTSFYARGASGELHVWGGNGYSCLGDGVLAADGDTGIVEIHPALVPAGVTLTQIAHGRRTFGLTASGEPYRFGSRDEVFATPRPATFATPRRFAAISSGNTHNLGITTDGELMIWSAATQLEPVPVAMPAPVLG